MILKVYTDIGKTRPVAMYAKVVEKLKKGKYRIKYLSPTTQSYEGKIIYKYEEDTYDIDDDSIMEYIKQDEEYIGYMSVDDIGFVRMESDSDYEESESDTSESEEESFIDSDQEDAFEISDFEENDE